MRRVSLYIAASVDGFIARRDGALDWLPRSQAPGDYGYSNFIRGIDTMVMGRRTYEAALRLGPWPGDDLRVVVFSRRKAGRRDKRADFIDGDVAGELRQMKAEKGRGIWLVGGGEILRPCLAGRVVDEIILTLPPVLIGEGIPLFLPQDVQTRLHLRECQSYPGGLVQLAYNVLN